jgi:hypothetical protein
MKRTTLAVGAAAAVAAVLGTAVPASAAPTGPVSQTPVSWTPQLATSGTDGSVETVRQLVPCGNMMYAVGTFTQIQQRTTVYTRNNAFSFDANTGAVSSWDPNVTGSVVDSIALSPDCSTAYLGGKFTSVGGTAVKNIAAVSTSTGQVLSTFAHNSNGRVAALVMANGHLLVGGYFTSINNSKKHYMLSLNPTTGRDDGYVDLNISGNYQYTQQDGKSTGSNPSRVWNYALSPDGSKLLVMGDFTSVGGVGRRQIFMLDLGPTAATVDPWYSTEFDQNCYVGEPFWLQDASWSPDMSTVYIAATGYKPASGLGFNRSDPRAGLCDAAAAFPATGTNVTHKWVNYTGCDSLYSTAADASTVYIGGHERYANNPYGCDHAGPGAVSAPGMAGLSPTTGQLSFNPTRGRGQGADDELITSAGLWIASDNAQNSSSCGKTATGAKAYNHKGICLLPYS